MIKLRKFKKKYYNKIYDFLYENYTDDRRLGFNASFFEYCFHTFKNKKNMSKEVIAFDKGKIVAYVSYERNPDEFFINYREDYIFLLDDLIELFEEKYKSHNECFKFHIFSSQKVLREKLRDRGYKIIESCKMLGYLYNYDINYSLPEGYFFEENINIEKMLELVYNGFDNKKDNEIKYKKKAKLYLKAPHKTLAYNTLVKDENGKYVAFGGVWLEKDNKLSYLEPLCTLKEEREKGLGRAVISKIIEKTKSSSSLLTGGANEFYEHLGFEEIYRDEIWVKKHN